MLAYLLTYLVFVTTTNFHLFYKPVFNSQLNCNHLCPFIAMCLT